MIPEELRQLPKSEYRVPYLKSTDEVFPLRPDVRYHTDLLFDPRYFLLWPRIMW